MAETAQSAALGRDVLLFDGECGVCQRSVRWLLEHDRAGRILYAPQGHPLAVEALERLGVDAEKLNTAVLVREFGTAGERAAIRSDVPLGCLELLGGGWVWVARVGRLVPRFLRDAAYRVFARYRMRLVPTSCGLPTEAERARFLGV